MTFTKDKAKELRNAFECWQQDYDPVDDKEQYDMFGSGMDAMDALLASLEAEPAAFVMADDLKDSSIISTPAYRQLDEARERNVGDVVALYTTPPAPVSVPEILPCPVLLEPGMRFGKGVRTQTMLDALQRRANYYAEMEAMTPEQRAEHDEGMKEFAALLQGKAEPVGQREELPDGFDFDRFNDVVWLEAVASNPQMHSLTTSTIAMVALELNRKLADGNSPVIPDGWVMVPVEPTEEMNKAGWTAMNEHDAINPTYRAMLASAPDFREISNSSTKNFRENAETSTNCPCCGRKPLKNRKCSVVGCEGRHVAHGLCQKHYDIEHKNNLSRRQGIREANKKYRARKSAAPQQES